VWLRRRLPVETLAEVGASHKAKDLDKLSRLADVVAEVTGGH